MNQIAAFLADLARREMGNEGSQQKAVERVVGEWFAHSPATVDDQDTFYLVVAVMVKAPIELPVYKTTFPRHHPDSVN